MFSCVKARLAIDFPLESLLQTLLIFNFHSNNGAFCLSHIFTNSSVLPKCPFAAAHRCISIMQILRSAQITTNAGRNTWWLRRTSHCTYSVNSPSSYAPPRLSVSAEQKGQYWQVTGGVSSAYMVLAVDMFWKLAVLCGVCVLLQRAEGERTVTFRRTQPGEKRNQVRARLSRDISGDQRPPRGPPFISCRTPLTPTEHRVLDDNTHEVRCSVTITDHGKGSFLCTVVWVFLLSPRQGLTVMMAPMWFSHGWEMVPEWVCSCRHLHVIMENQNREYFPYFPGHLGAVNI